MMMMMCDTPFLQIILASEAARQDAINRAAGDAEALFKKAEAQARALDVVGDAIRYGAWP